MTTDDKEHFVNFLHNRVGRHLRAVVRYNPNSYTVAYARGDLDDGLDDRIDRIINTLTSKESDGELDTNALNTSLSDEFGETYISLQIREDAVIINLPWGTNQGTILSLDPTAASQLMGFITDCMRNEYHGKPA